VSFIIFIVVSYILLSVSLYMLFPKADVEGWKGLVPGLNFVEWCKIIGRSPWHAIFLLFPIVNIFIYCGMAVDMVRSFGKYKLIHSTIAVIYAPAIFFRLAMNKDEKYVGPTLIQEREYKEALEDARKSNNPRKFKKLQANNPYKKTAGREWFEAIVFAVFAAAFIRMFLIEAYKIPTPSMEGSLLVGDFLFVSKAHYGIRMPMTPLMIPLLHNRIPLIGGESYLKNPSLPYRRLPALESIERNEPIVFNWPVGDSIYYTPQRTWTHRQAQYNPVARAATRGRTLITRPLDKKDHYIKRCIAIPGDTLQIIDRQVYINGKAAENPSEMQFAYEVISKVPLNPEGLREIGVDPGQHVDLRGWTYWLTEDQAEQIRSFGDVQVNVIPHNEPGVHVFPHDVRNFGMWSTDNYGPIWIPKKGVTVDINAQNIALYERIINVYEQNDYAFRDGKIYINGEESTRYTFQQDYYWAMGDNRHNSEDSRIWGFVPADHIVGKPLFIWMSINNGIRWNRIFTSANKM
jgi:signal peptidase I